MRTEKALDKNNLKLRYLLWLYKTTKEELDRINRNFTQLQVDEFMFKILSANLKSIPKPQGRPYKRYLRDFSNYISDKRRAGLGLKFDKSGQTNPSYRFLKDKLSSIEKAIKRFLGQKKLKEIKSLYHQEMLRRILEERQHKKV